MDNKKLLIPETGKDEMNLVEFPITLLSKRHSAGIKTMEFSDEIMGEGGKLVKRGWIITGTDRFGLPLAIDDDVLMAILSIGKEHNFSSPTIYFSRYRLCKIMRWSIDGRSYKRIEDALKRLKGMSIYADNAFWDNERKGYITLGFGIIESYSLFDSSKSLKQDELSLSSVDLNKYLYKSILNGYIKSIDVKIYFRLNSAVAKRLFRYLDKKRYDGKRKFEINLFTLAEVHIGLQKTKYASQIKQQLDPAHEELIQIGFLKNAEYQKTSDQTSEKVVYSFGKKAELLEPSQTDQKHMPEKSLDPELLERLVQLGITRKVTEQILREYPEETVRIQIEALKYRKADDPAAILISSILNKWAIPAAYEAHLRKEKLKTIDINQQEQERRLKTEHRERIQEHLSTLSRDELAEITMQARELAREEGGALFRNREIPQYMVNAYVHIIVEKKLGIQELIKMK